VTVAHSQVFFSPAPLGLSLDAVQAKLSALESPILVMRERCVIHHQIDPQAVEDFIGVVQQMADEVRAGRKKQLNAEGKEIGEDIKLVEEGELRKHAVLGY
jgi:threonine aldolase